VLDQLKQEVLEANVRLGRTGLAPLTWGNVSGIDRQKGVVVIKPSGVSYEEITAGDMVVVRLDGRKVEGRLNPSSDTPTHLILYEAFKEVGGICHTHSPYACMFAQTCREIPCLGTTHADLCAGPVPITRPLTEAEVREAYEANTGRVIVERFRDLQPTATGGVLVAHHGPFTWGKNPVEALNNAIALEAVAAMAFGTLLLNPGIGAIPEFLLAKHYQRKHGPQAYYGQRPYSDQSQDLG